MERKRQILIFITIVALLVATNYLYELQLGAIPFFLLSILFFSLAYKQFPRRSKPREGKKQK